MTEQIIPRLPNGNVLVLRNCKADGTSYGGFKWPDTCPAEVVCPDWAPKPECGHGLHGLLWGRGDGSLLSWDHSAKWLVIEVDTDNGLIDLGGKVKFRIGVVVHCGDRRSATQFLADSGHNDFVVGGTATAGDRGTATAGDNGTATAGDRGTATAGDNGTATAGYRGTATAGDRGTATAGDNGLISIVWWDRNKYRRAMALVGTCGIKPNTAYFLNDIGGWVEVTHD